MVREFPPGVNRRERSQRSTPVRADRIRWDARYAAGDCRHDVDPAPLLAAWIPRLRPARPARALDVAAGLGRHALLLARQGWTVDAVDISMEGLRILRRRAVLAGARINLILADLDRFECRPASYDLIVHTFFLKRRLIARLWRWLRPGGVLYFETHLAVQGGGGHSRFALRPGEAAGLFARWEILEASEGPVGEGDREIETARLVVRRPEARGRGAPGSGGPSPGRAQAGGARAGA